jgi:hypothetical protein
MTGLLPDALQHLLSKLFKRRRRATRRPSVNRVRPLCEPLEERWLLSGVSASGGFQHSAAGLVVQDLTTGLTAADLVQQLVGSDVQVKNAKFTSWFQGDASNDVKNGQSSSAGVFSGGTGIIGFDSGIILSTGGVKNVIGPNESSGISQDNGLPGDEDLSALAQGPTNDATVLEFDFKPTFSTLTVEYVFASDEYNRYVGSFNDVFGFFVNGHDQAHDIATITGSDGSTIPVSISNVNGGNPVYGVPASNSQYYIDNDPFNPTSHPAPAPLNTEMNGLTTVLTATAQVNPGTWNHIKLAIADAGDSAVDSNVFLKASSFSSNTNPTVSLSNIQAHSPSGTGVTQDEARNLTVPVGTEITGNWSFADPDPGQTWTAKVDYGDSPTSVSVLPAVQPGQQYNLDHTYNTPGSYALTVTVTDSAGGKGFQTLLINVLSPSQADNVEQSNSTTISSGNNDLNVRDSSGNQLDATLFSPADNAGTMSEVIYRNNPINSGVFGTQDGTHFYQSLGTSFDLRVAGPDGGPPVQLLVGGHLSAQFSIHLPAAEVAALPDVSTIKLLYWDGSNWQFVTDPATGKPITATLVPDKDGSATLTFTASINPFTSNPTLLGLSGTVFTIGIPAAPPPGAVAALVNVTPPVTVVSNTSAAGPLGFPTLVSDAVASNFTAPLGQQLSFGSDAGSTLVLRVSQETQTSVSQSSLSPGAGVGNPDRADTAVEDVANLFQWLQSGALPDGQVDHGQPRPGPRSDRGPGQPRQAPAAPVVEPAAPPPAPANVGALDLVFGQMAREGTDPALGGLGLFPAGDIEASFEASAPPSGYLAVGAVLAGLAHGGLRPSRSRRRSLLR